jgi:predicted secreted protein
MIPGSDDPARVRARDTWLVLLLYAALAVLLAYPISVHPASLTFPAGPDTELGAFLIGWDSHAFLHDPLSIFDANFYHPQRLTLAYSENLIGVALLVAPIVWLTGNAVLAANVACLLSAMLCGLGAYLLARRVGLGVAAAVLCGVIFECSPPRFFRIGQLHLTSVQWIPFALASLHAYLDRGRRRDLLLAVAFVSLQALSSGHGAAFMVMAVGVLLAWRVLLGEPLLLLKRLRDFGIAGVLVILPTALVFLPYRIVQHEMGLKRDLHNTSIMWESFLASPSHLQMWVLALFNRLQFNDTASAYLFPGYVPLALAVMAIGWQVRHHTVRPSPRTSDQPARSAEPEPLPRPEISKTPQQGRSLLRTVLWRSLALIVDGVGLVLLVLAAEVFRFGAVKVRAGEAVLFSTRTGWRPLLLAALLVALRVVMLAWAPVTPVRWARRVWACVRPRLSLARWMARIRLAAGALARAWTAWERRARAVRRSAMGFYVVLTLLSIWLTLGPPLGIWRYVYWLPGLNFIRVPSRFSIVAMLGLSVVAAFGFERVSAHLRRMPRVALATIVGILMVAEFAAMPLASVAYSVESPDVDQWLDSRPKPFAIAEVPLPNPRFLGPFERRQTLFMRHSMAHWQKTVNGYSGFRPPLHEALYEMMRTFPDEASLNELLRLDVRYVVMHTDLYEPGEWEPVEARLQQFDGWLRLEHVAGAGRVYSLHRAGATVMKAQDAKAPGEPGSPQKAGAAMVLAEKAHDTEVVLAVGDTVAVRLVSNPSTGYSWQVGKCDPAVLQPDGKPVFEEPAHPMPGAPGIAVLRFRAAATGTTPLELWYLRPWEKHVAPAKAFRVTIRVR